MILCAVVLALAALGARPTDAANNVSSPLQHYSTDDRSIGFVLDQSQDPPLMRFDSSPEILVLEPVAGPRGDTIYKRDDGFSVIRETNLGGLTVFDEERPEGRPVFQDGDALRLGLRRHSLEELQAEALDLSETLTKLLGVEVAVALDRNALDSETAAALLGDTLAVVEIALERMAGESASRNVLADRLRRVSLRLGDRAGAEFQGDNLILYFVPADGVRGRMSSGAIVRYLKSTL